MLISSTTDTSIYSGTTTDTSSLDLSSTDFITLLVAQLEYQDPLNPVEDTDMLSELATMSSLEQLTTMNETLTDMAESINASLINSAVGFIGMEVVAEGDTITKGEDGVSSVSYTLSEDVTAASAYIYDADGELVDTVLLEDLDEGTHSFTWDGMTSDNEEAADGSYTVSILSQDEAGDLSTVSTQVTGVVVGLASQNGSTVFELEDGSYIDLLAVSAVHAPTS